MKKLLFALFSAVVALFGLGGCASVSKQATNVYPDPKADKGLVYFYREKHFAGMAVSYNIKEQGKVIGAIANGTYFFVDADPGQHTYTASTESDVTKTVDVEAGKTYYVKCGVDIGFWAGRPSMSQVVEAEAKSTIRELTYATKPAQ